MAIKYFQWPLNRPNGQNICQDFPLQDPQKFSQIGIFGLKTNHLATLFGALIGLHMSLKSMWAKA
jgi:hypothetical protein